MYVLKNGKNFYIRIENGSVIKTPKFVEATKFRNTEIAQTVIDLKPGQLHSYRVCDVYNKIVYPKGRTRVIYTPRERKMIYHKAEGRCQLCGCKITYDEMSLDQYRTACDVTHSMGACLDILFIFRNLHNLNSSFAHRPSYPQ